MGGHQVTSTGSGDDGYGEDGYDESQRAEILEATRDGPSDGAILTDLAPDMGGDIDEPDEDDVTDLSMRDGETGEERASSDDRSEEDDEDDAQEEFEAGTTDDDDLDDTDDVALRP